MWTTPKTNWKSSDIVYLEDWQRWVNNALHLYNLLGEPFEWLECSLGSKWDIPYCDVVNNLESNLGKLCSSMQNTSIEFTQKTWYPVVNTNWKGNNPSYVDFNRWEQFEQAVYSMLVSPQILRSGNFTAGQNRVRQTLGRSVN